MKKKNIYIIVFISIIATSCFSVYQTSNFVNFASLYNPGRSSLHPEFIVYHDSDTSSLLYTRINPRELLFNRSNPRNALAARLQIRYELYNAQEKGELCDSGSVTISIGRRSSTRPLITYIRINTLIDKNYNLIVTSTDVLREESMRSYLNVNRSEPFHKQNFLVMKKGDQMPFFNTFVACEDTIIIETRLKNHNKWKVKYYGEEFRLAPPPFSEASYDSLKIKADSVWTYKFDRQFQFRQKYKGLYHYQLDNNDGGVSLTTFSPYFPEVKRPRQLIPPIQFLTTSKEFNELKNNENPKLAVDEFWLNSAGSIEGGKELIRIYYSRIYYANIYFSSHVEGWKTDRGMIYTVFGPPNIVNRSDSTEKWVYNDRKSFKTISFEFRQTNKKFTDKHFELKRNYYYNDFWQRAVKSWRNGRIFYLGS